MPRMTGVQIKVASDVRMVGSDEKLCRQQDGAMRMAVSDGGVA